jgi:hypothetical protein
MSTNPDRRLYGRIIRTGSLTAFLAEVAPGAVVRLVQNHLKHEPWRTLYLHAQALTATGELVWLCEAHQIMYWSDSGPAGPQDRQVAAGMAVLQKLLRDHLLAAGFQVRDDTEYGLPEWVKPLRGNIGRWVQGPDGSLSVNLDLASASSDRLS